MAVTLFVLYLLFTLIALYHAWHPQVWIGASIVYLVVTTFFIGLPWIAGIFLWAIIIAIMLTLQVQSVRAAISAFLYARAGKSLPKLSKTEEDALNAGDTWLEEDIFTGMPVWEKLSQLATQLTAEEQAFLQHETEELCAMINDWDFSQQRDLPEHVWTYLKEKGFFGLVISKEYGGKGFSARAHSDVVMKIASRSGAAAVTVMVPNSLGPGELLQHYGTAEQKSYYLPRLAKGIDIPCFALTEPEAGSDATSIQSEAIVVQKEMNGQQVLGLSITLNKRWITLSPVATLIGLAVNLKDPNGLLQGKGEEGITCLLISREAEHLEIGNRHLPADQWFMNGTIRGENIFAPITSIIGGQEQAGHGWQMLVECLSIGRSISLPALGAASSSVSYIATGAYARVRRQFNVELAQFEGIEEKLAEIAGLNYLVNATRLMTVAAVNQGKKPSVASAITKYFNTELARIAVNAAMDVHGGRTVVIGPRNYLASFYQSIPISVTVEGANIMSRNLLIFGQGSMACHPFIRKEFYALSSNDKEQFAEIIWQHISYFMRNFAKATLSAWTGGFLIAAPKSPMRREYQRLARLSYAYAWIADLALIYLGGNLKRKERLSARLADGMSYLYMAMAALTYFEQHRSKDHELHAKWAVTYCFYHAQKAMIDFCENFPSRMLGWLIRFFVFPGGQSMLAPRDKLDHQLARLMTQNNAYRQEICSFIYMSGDKKEPLDKVEQALQALIAHDNLYKKIRSFGRIKLTALREKLESLVKHNELSIQEMEQVIEIEKLRWDAIQVDEFSFADVKEKRLASLTDSIKGPLD
ncbi:acyl-CoA dehydrogenase [Legionella septentrionalis]|uniref:Acyl-coenzyme A dehydrogenase n=1 Tax=Legionella septentrionalis TaxID=2498109 RepID=A0A433JH08_9GAMM|nr:acyl-CoA dehydrogenase [Legionella septentrionalis]RUQ81588.1 acyl-CoA dehydrogenase [Legionella septentrionalis]RUQ96432.1 acyl-CoA dehydrogenase [Legionella septentrionalis]